MKTYIWIMVLFILMIAAAAATGALAADSSGSQASQAEANANTVTLAKTGPLAQVYTAGVVLLLVLMALAPLAFGREPGAGIHIQ